MVGGLSLTVTLNARGRVTGNPGDRPRRNGKALAPASSLLRRLWFRHL